MNRVSSRAPDSVQLLSRFYDAALQAADPRVVLPRHLPPPPSGRLRVVGVGKAAAAMAAAVEAHYGVPLEGSVVVPHGAQLTLQHIEVLSAPHPIPDTSSVAAAQRLLSRVAGLNEDDLVLALISGGGSALCALPQSGVSLHEKQALTRALLLGGASIHELNIVRKHLSQFKGGRLLQAALPARVHSFVISDIPGDDLGMVASGPTFVDASTCAEALAVLEKYGIDMPESVGRGLTTGAFETPKVPLSEMNRNPSVMVTCAMDGLQAAAAAVRQQGFTAHIISDALEGEAIHLAKAHADIALKVQRGLTFSSAPCVLLSGGEATVKVRGKGKGGRNTEFILALAHELRGARGIFALSAGTDGLDGTADAAGAWATPATLEAGACLGYEAPDFLARNDSFTYLHALDACVVTGPTHTNINDFRAVLVLPA
ncbi:glycerate kinase type-2 family protein [Piscinibacter terrae]|uniref:glycerate kinase type-2 family protein n=1 Tax=Piscinibacter terrae TaxID=2496871 RepID=UPI001F358392|nr:glycerate kinase [Albitalea terrae]